MQSLAGIVLYQPDTKKLKRNIDAIIQQVAAVIIVDNASSNRIEIDELLKKYDRIVYIRNAENAGIAKALNQIVDKADEMGAEWVVTLDQDSECKSGIVKAYEDVLSKYENVGIVTSVFEDRNAKLDHNAEGDSQEVSFCITSASFTNVKAIKKVGGFDEKMFIDMVDYDICYALRRQGYHIIRVNTVGFVHEVGESREIRFLGEKIIVFNHSALRKYYWVRNSVYLTRKYGLDKRKSKKRIRRRMIETFLFEKNKIKKLKAMFKGLKDGKKM